MDSADCRDVQRQIDDIRRNRRSQSLRDLATLASSLGYTIDRERGKGVFTGTRSTARVRTFPFRPTATPYQSE